MEEVWWRSLEETVIISCVISDGKVEFEAFSWPKSCHAQVIFSVGGQTEHTRETKANPKKSKKRVRHSGRMDAEIV